MLTRRQFLKGAVSAAACLTVFRVVDTVTDRTAGYDRYNPDQAVGPMVMRALSFRQTETGFEAGYEGEKVLETNEAGYALMKLADGSHSLDELIRQDITGASPEEIADFFLLLGQAGWLENRLEVTKYVVES